MYSDLLDVLGNQSSPSAARGESENHVAVTFKAGKMKMDLQEVSLLLNKSFRNDCTILVTVLRCRQIFAHTCLSALHQNGKYWVTPDTRRGQVQLIWSSGELKWEWLDRRDKSVVDSVTVEQGGKFERIETMPDERVYLWSCGKKWNMYWMQDLVREGEDELIAQVNQYLANPADAAPEGEGSATNSSSAQVDALSNILENLGMPETPGEQPTGTLTLADLQGAMQGLQTTTTTASTPTPLSEVVTPAAVASLLEDEEAKNRLLELLPEEQRSMEHLEENLRSPQIQQTLRALTQALVPDDVGSLEGYHSVIANFQLDPKDGEAALAAGNPIQAFLDCILASVKKEEEETKEETKEDAMEE